MSIQSWTETVYVQGAGAALTAAAEALLVSDVTIPAGYMYPGRILHGVIVGKESSAATTPGTMTLRLRWGGIAGTILATSGALTRNTNVQIDETWILEYWIQCLTIGSTGTFLTWAKLTRGTQPVAAFTDAVPNLLPVDTLAAVTVDTTSALALSVTAQPSLNTGSLTALAYKLVAEN